MCFLRCLCSTALILQFPASALPQQSAPAAQRDPQALAVLTQAFAAMGGAKLSLISDTTAQATVTIFDGDPPATGTVTFRTRGTGQVRAEFVTSDGASMAVYNAGAGATRSADGTVQQFPPSQVINKRADHLPLFSMLAEYADPAVGVHLLGTDTVNGSPVWRVGLQRLLSGEVDPRGLYAPFARCEVFIDQATGLAVKLRHDVPTAENLLKRVPMEFAYSDYRPEAGLLIPHTITQYLAGTRIAVFQITSFAVNTGLTDLDFVLPR